MILSIVLKLSIINIKKITKKTLDTINNSVIKCK